MVRTIRALSPSALLLGATSFCLPASGTAARTASDLKAGVEACEKGDYAEGVRRLRSFARQSPKLADYADYQAAECLAADARWDEAISTLEQVWRTKPPSPLAGKAAALSAEALLKAGSPTRARETLRAHWSELEQPEGELLLAKSFDAQGDGASAAVHYQRVYFGYPGTTAEKEADKALSRLRDHLGDKYPPVLPPDVFERADRLINAKDYDRARQELNSWAAQFAGEDRELAEVRAAAAGFLAGSAREACEALRTLKVTGEDADAERLYHVTECARREDSDDALAGAMAYLERNHAQSQWRLKALVSVGNRHLVRNEPERYTPYYRACYTSFPDSTEAAHCHWKVTWSLHLGQRADASAMMREHLIRFPASDHAPAALYFLARAEETSGDTGAAKALYLKLRAAFPGSYYRIQADKRLQEAAISSAAESPAAAAPFAHLTSSRPKPLPSFQPNAASLARIGRARLLVEAGFPKWAENELRYGARNGQAYVLAMEMARTAARRNEPSQSVSYIKALAQGYLTLSFEDAPAEFWRLAYPLPYRALIQRYAAANKLDVNVLAALIRQESVFDAQAVSRSNAMGLTQVMPATGRQLARKFGIRRFRNEMLHRPDVNLRLGAYYLRATLDQFDGRIEPALAAYNAGASRVRSWLGWSEYREPAEFVESIPFAETNHYVRIVMHNAEAYRALYGRQAAPAKAVRKAATKQPAKAVKKAKAKKPVKAAQKTKAKKKKHIRR
ncbi:MAG: lytic transglycosylase domain-containing protein [Acidobacteriales bacterium]|nr:lytic transglycosylase domain-containing protein [Terriglobales bacterium]